VIHEAVIKFIPWQYLSVVLFIITKPHLHILIYSKDVLIITQKFDSEIDMLLI